MSSPMYSFTPEEAGMLPMVLSIACAEGRHEDCATWFRCDCAHHRRTPKNPGQPPSPEGPEG